MNQRELNHAVARQTGESVRTIERLGFLLSEPEVQYADPDHEGFGPHVIDWDAFAVHQAIESQLACA